MTSAAAAATARMIEMMMFLLSVGMRDGSPSSPERGNRGNERWWHGTYRPHGWRPLRTTSIRRSVDSRVDLQDYSRTSVEAGKFPAQSVYARASERGLLPLR